MKVVCPSCKTEFNVPKLKMIKILRHPYCERCGAHLFEDFRDQAELAPGRVVCPRCHQEQEATDFCKWCGAVIVQARQAKRTQPRPGDSPAPERAGQLPRPSGLSKFVGFLPLVLLIIYFVAVSDFPSLAYEAYQFSVPIVRENKRLKDAVGGRIEYGPIPVFFWKKTEAPQREIKASLYFWVKGPASSAWVCVRLRRPIHSEGAWEITPDSYFRVQKGRETPLLEKRAPAA